MRRRQQSEPLPSRDYAAEIDRLHHQLATLTLRWRGVAPPPPSLTEAVEALGMTLEQLHAMNADLTQNQQAALEMQQRYQELFDGVPEAYLVTDLTGLIQEANRAAATLFHLEHTRLIGLPLAVLIAREMRQSFRNQLTWLRNGAEVRDWVIRVQPQHHPAVPVVCQAAPAHGVAGQLVGFRWLLRDSAGSQRVQEILERRVRELAAALDATREHAELRRRELHHCMKDYLQLASSLLDWHGEDLQDSRSRMILESCQRGFQVIALLHEILASTVDAERVDLGHYLRRLALQMLEAYGIDLERIHLTLQAETISIDVHRAVHCGLLVHEILFNYLQHALPTPPAGTLAIILQEEPAGQMTLIIRHTGREKSTDSDVRPEDSFKLALIRKLTEQLQGTLVLTHDGGTCITFRCPV